jgi:hypothetical protein
MAVTADKLVKAYVKMRDAKEKLTADFTAQEATLKEQMATIETALLELCKTTGADSLKTAYGTASRTVKTRYWTADWDAMHTFIKEHDSADLLERRIAQNNMKAFLEEHPDVMPVGLNIERKYAVVVRRS